jgi:hypothetical protein
MSSSDPKHMSNPPTDQTKMVKIKAIYPIRVGKGDAETVITPGNTVEVSESEAKEFCDKSFNLGMKDTFGNRHPSEAHAKIVKRAERV